MRDAINTAILLVDGYNNGQISIPDTKYEGHEAIIGDLGTDFCKILGRDNQFSEELAFAIEMARRGWYDEQLLDSARNSPSAKYIDLYRNAKIAAAI